MVVAVVNNLPELILGSVFAAVTFRAGIAYARWRSK